VALLSSTVRIAIDYRPALRTRTGVGYWVFHLARALLAHGRLDLTLFTSSWKDRPLPDDVSRLEGARIVDRRLPVRVLNLLWHRVEWPSIERLAGEPFDVAYSPHPLLMPARRAAQVVTIHDLDFLTNPERAGAEIRRDYPRLVRDHAWRAAHVIVISHYTARQVERHLGLPPERMTVCYPGVPDWVSREGQPIHRTAEHVLFVGTLERRKNIGTLLDAYAALVARRPEAPPLVLAGRARPEAAPWLERIARPPLAGRVRCLGYVSEEHRRHLFETAALFVMPSLEEGFGLPVVEAMGAGVPVVVSNRGALPEVVEQAGLVVEAEDAQALSGAMERMLADEAFRSAAVAQGLRRAARFRWDDTARSVLTAYERALGRCT
jgi:glycosyltransferase involved in cell wall biosynthesis